MSLDLINKIIVAMNEGEQWCAHLLCYSHSKRNGTMTDYQKEIMIKTLVSIVKKAQRDGFSMYGD